MMRFLGAQPKMFTQLFCAVQALDEVERIGVSSPKLKQQTELLTGTPSFMQTAPIWFLRF